MRSFPETREQRIVFLTAARYCTLSSTRAARHSPVEISSLPELYVADVKEKYERLKSSR